MKVSCKLKSNTLQTKFSQIFQLWFGIYEVKILSSIYQKELKLND